MKQRRVLLYRQQSVERIGFDFFDEPVKRRSEYQADIMLTVKTEEFWKGAPYAFVIMKNRYLFDHPLWNAIRKLSPNTEIIYPHVIIQSYDELMKLAQAAEGY